MAARLVAAGLPRTAAAVGGIGLTEADYNNGPAAANGPTTETGQL